MKLSALLGSFALLLLTSCGFLQGELKAPPAASESASAPGKAGTVQVRSSASQSKASGKIGESEKPPFDRKAIDVHLGKGEYREALQGLTQGARRGIPEKDLLPEYLLCLNGAIEKAQALLSESDPAQAGLLFRVVLDAYPRDSDIVASADLQPAELEGVLKVCADQLMDKGLVAYRAGNMGQAIDIWKQALIFYPTHQSCQMAIQTTYAQLANLQKITADQ